ncbi:MAG: DUF4159 domain-containing protein [Candidatus Nealsonbacteria bacterium]|nr:DUF4159 domain-containing protein [Candidatus Nealsonbacteria bacterium]
MKRLVLVCLMAAVLSGPSVPMVRAEITAEQVRDAIARGAGFLKQQQRRADGSWPEFVGHPGGVTSLCTLALLNSGVPTNDPHVERALEYLRGKTFKSTYTVALQTMVLCKSGHDLDEVKIRQNVKYFESRQIRTGPNKGAWAYDGRGGNGDNSNTQFALLALHEAERAGVTVSEPTWTLAREYWQGCQNIDGSFGYRPGHSGTGSMTCAGIASLIITADQIGQSNAKAERERVRCCLGGEGDGDQVERAMDWLGRNFSVKSNPGVPGRVWQLYFFYGVERAGRLSARRFIGKHDWYRKGSEYLVDTQDRLSGFWEGVGRDEANHLIATSYALLFLSKGRRPILISKLKHSPGDDFNAHRHDVGNLTRYVESRWKFDMTWQIVDLDAASVEDLLQSPVLYYCGGKNALPATDEARERLAGKLRDYLDRGGFLFAEAYQNDTGFDAGFRKLMKRVFTEPEYQLQRLDAGHPIWRIDEQVVQPRWLEGIEFGCRTSVVYAKPDPPSAPRPSMSCLWELSRGGRAQEFAPEVQAQVQSALALGINVLAYATNRELTGKEEYLETSSDGPTDSVPRGRIVIAKLQHPGGCNAAPRALATLMKTAGQKLKIRTGTRDQLLKISDKALFDYHIVFMHGRHRFRLTTTERQQLKTYIERGGMLFADSICASKAFTESFRSEMATMFPDRKLVRIPADDPMLATKYGGSSLKSVTRREPRQQGDDGPMKTLDHKGPPDLEGIEVDGRWGVIFSRYDVSCALEKHNSLECHGYTREDAAKIGLNVLLYSLQ